MSESVQKAALRTWVRTVSKLPDTQIVWANQDLSRLTGQFITMLLGDLAVLGSADEVTHDYDADRDPGQEIEISVQGRRSFPLSLQCFGNGDLSGRALLSRLQTSLSFPSVLSLFEAADIACYDAGPIQDVTAVLETTFEPRAAMELYFHGSEVVSERNTFIETVEVEDEINDTTFTVPED